MKKINQNINLNNNSLFGKVENRTKTTNVNILLNRVRLDEKKDFKKKLVLFFIFVAIFSSLIFLVLL